MAYSFKTADRTVTDGVQRMALAQLTLALEAMDDMALTLDQKVHATRRRIKKVRALIRLVRPVFPAYEDENAALREAAKRLSSARDAAVVIETFDRMTAIYADALGGVDIAPVRDRLVAVRRSMSDAEIGVSLLESRADLFAMRERVDGWSLKEKEAAAFREGLQKTYRKAVRTLSRSKDTGDFDDLHEWRKWAKTHWLHVRLLKRMWPEGLEPRAAALDRLTDDLGEHHDLSVLIELLCTGEEGADPRVDAFVKGPAADRLAQLERDAWELGDDLFAETPKVFARRCAGYWTVWREEGGLL